MNLKKVKDSKELPEILTKFNVGEGMGVKKGTVSEVYGMNVPEGFNDFGVYNGSESKILCFLDSSGKYGEKGQIYWAPYTGELREELREDKYLDSRTRLIEADEIRIIGKSGAWSALSNNRTNLEKILKRSKSSREYPSWMDNDEALNWEERLKDISVNPNEPKNVAWLKKEAKRCGGFLYHYHYNSVTDALLRDKESADLFIESCKKRGFEVYGKAPYKYGDNTMWQVMLAPTETKQMEEEFKNTKGFEPA